MKKLSILGVICKLENELEYWIKNTISTKKPNDMDKIRE